MALTLLVLKLPAQAVLLARCVRLLTVMVYVNAMRESTRLAGQQVAPLVPVDLPVQIRQVITRWSVDLERFQMKGKRRVHLALLACK